MNQNTIISTRGLSYLDFIHFPDLDFLRGSITFICGESGSGKTSLLKLMNATVSPSSGMVLYQDRDIMSIDSLVLRREVLLMSQSSYLFDGSIRENFQQYYNFREIESPSASEILGYLDICAADFFLDAVTQNLSGGERQRVFLAIGLSFKPEVLLLDEPSSALDEATSRKLFSNLKDFCKSEGITLIVVSHDLALAKLYADQIIELKVEERS